MAGNVDSVVLEEIRVKSRQDRKEIRGKKRDSIIFSKRAHLSDIQSEFDDISDDQVRELAIQVRKCSKDRIVLQKLKHAFILDDNKKEIFLKTDGAVHGLVGLLTCNDVSLCLETLGCLINLLTAHHRMLKSLVRETVPYLISYLHSGGALMQELAAWALGNIAADCPQCCLILKSQRFIQVVLPLLKGNHVKEVTHCALFALRYYMQNVPEEWREILDSGLNESLPILLKFDGDVLQETLNVVFFFSSCAQYDQYLLDSGCFQAVINHLCRITSSHDQAAVEINECQCLTFLVRILAALSSESEVAIRIILQMKSIEATIEYLLSCNYIHIQKETLWLLGNLAGHTIQETSAFFNSPSILNSISRKLFGPPSIVVEALTCLCNLMGSTDKRVTQLASSYVSNSILQNILSSINPDVIFNALLLLSLILRDTSSDSISRDRNALFMAVQQLASNSDPSIRSQAVAFLQCIGL